MKRFITFALICVMAWWFISVARNGWGGDLAVVGPFPTENLCNDFREWVKTHTRQYLNDVGAPSPCWQS